MAHDFDAPIVLGTIVRLDIQIEIATTAPPSTRKGPFDNHTQYLDWVHTSPAQWNNPHVMLARSYPLWTGTLKGAFDRT
jgi:hypothetical protein